MWGREFALRKVQKELNDKQHEQWEIIGLENGKWSPVTVVSFRFMHGVLSYKEAYCSRTELRIMVQNWLF